MKQIAKEELIKSIGDFSLPKYNEIPNVGLYLEQTSKYVSEFSTSLLGGSVTGSMIGNYVKMGLLSNPIKKQYDRNQIAYLIFISIAKTVLSMEDIKLLIEIQKKSYDPQKAYNYFCAELENTLSYVFEIREAINLIGEDESEEKRLLRNVIIAIAHKVYLDKYFSSLHEKNEP